MILKVFYEEFGLTKTDAAGLLNFSIYLLGHCDEFKDHLPKILVPSKDNFTEAQAVSALKLMRQIAVLSDHSANLKTTLCAQAERVFQPEPQNKSGWT